MMLENFHHLMGGGVLETPSNSAPIRARDEKCAWELVRHNQESVLKFLRILMLRS